MNLNEQRHFIETTELGAAPKQTRSLTNIQDSSGLIAGGEMLAFADDVPGNVRSAVTMSLLFAQEAAKADPAVLSPDEWVERHDEILKTLGWASVGGASQFTQYEKSGLSVHKAILPLLTAALGPAATAGSLILTGLEQLQEIDNDKPWITLFDKESRRFEHNEYRFITAETQGNTVLLRIVALRFKASAKRIQILFFKTKDVDIEFTVATRSLSSDLTLLEQLHDSLNRKLADRAQSLIDEIDLPAFQ